MPDLSKMLFLEGKQLGDFLHLGNFAEKSFCSLRFLINF
jgi:hypothetical protein